MVELDFPYCCTMKVLAGFGQSMVAEGGPVNRSEQEIRGFIEGEKAANANMAALVVTTNDEQTTVNKVLRELGFKGTKWMTKKQHSETKVKIWWLPLNEEVPKALNKPVKLVKKVKKVAV
jgi:hypothetical protein